MKTYNILILLILGINHVTANYRGLGTIIGIDIGNTFSSVGVYRNGKVEIVENEFASKVTPSIVSFLKNGNVSVARDAQTRDGSNSIFDLKYLLGKFAEDNTIQNNLKNWPFILIDRNNQPLIEITSAFGKNLLTAEDVTSMLIKYLKNMTESFLVQEVHNCVITHPVYFDNNQRVAIKKAAKLAGLEVIRLIKEPVAAALAFGLDKRGNHRNVLVYHLGGSSSDVTLLSFEDGVFEVIANIGNVNLGGNVFNTRVVDYLKKKYETKTNHVLDKDEIKILQRKVEKAKIALSTQYQVQIDINGEVEILTRKKFEELNIDLFEKTIKSVSQVLEDSFLNITDVQDIVFIGGSTRIPKVRELVRNFFDGKEPVQGVEPDLAVATGAAMEAGKIQGPSNTMFESAVDWIVSKLFRTGTPQHDELR